MPPVDLMIQRRRLHNRLEFSEQFWLLLFQVAYYRLVREQFREITQGGGQVCFLQLYRGNQSISLEEST